MHGALSESAAPAKPRRRPAGKPAGRPDDSKVKVTLYLTGDLAKRFAVHATYSDMDKSELFAEMVKEHCKRYVVQDRQKAAAADSTDRPDLAGE